MPSKRQYPSMQPMHGRRQQLSIYELNANTHTKLGCRIKTVGDAHSQQWICRTPFLWDTPETELCYTHVPSSRTFWRMLEPETMSRLSNYCVRIHTPRTGLEEHNQMWPRMLLRHGERHRLLAPWGRIDDRDGLDPNNSARIIQLYVTPRLLHGLEAIITSLQRGDIGELARFCQIQSLPESTAWGHLPSNWFSAGWGDDTPGPCFNMNMSYYQYKKSHCGDKTILRPSYLHNGISYTGKTMSLYWIRCQHTLNLFGCICSLYQLASRQMACKDIAFGSWFVQV